MQALGHAGEGGANPKTDKPGATALAPFVAADGAIDRARDEGAEKRLGHDDTPEEKSAAGAEMDEAGQKSAPRAAEPIADEKGQRDGGRCGERDREPGRRRR